MSRTWWGEGQPMRARYCNETNNPSKFNNKAFNDRWVMQSDEKKCVGANRSHAGSQCNLSRRYQYRSAKVRTVDIMASPPRFPSLPIIRITLDEKRAFRLGCNVPRTSSWILPTVQRLTAYSNDVGSSSVQSKFIIKVGCGRKKNPKPSKCRQSYLLFADICSIYDLSVTINSIWSDCTPFTWNSTYNTIIRLWLFSKESHWKSPTSKSVPLLSQGREFGRHVLFHELHYVELPESIPARKSESLHSQTGFCRSSFLNLIALESFISYQWQN